MNDIFTGRIPLYHNMKLKNFSKQTDMFVMNSNHYVF